jgi:hypothetical protein
MSKLICHASECDNSTSETFFHCEQHGGEDGEGEGESNAEPREDDDIALGLDEEETEDETYDTLEEKYAD